jgi:hypothetical protein
MVTSSEFEMREVKRRNLAEDGSLFQTDSRNAAKTVPSQSVSIMHPVGDTVLRGNPMRHRIRNRRRA